MGLTIVREKITDSTLDAISVATVAEFSESFYLVVKYNLVCDLWLRCAPLWGRWLCSFEVLSRTCAVEPIWCVTSSAKDIRLGRALRKLEVSHAPVQSRP